MHDWPRAARAGADEALVERIRVVHDADNTYGVPRITGELSDGVPTLIGSTTSGSRG